MVGVILIVEDERHILRLLQVNLQRQGYRVEIAASGAEALDKIGPHIGMAVIDETLPDMSGGELVRLIRENPENAHIRLVLMDKEPRSGDEDPRGPDLLLTKPFNPMQLLGFWASS